VASVPFNNKYTVASGKKLTLPSGKDEIASDGQGAELDQQRVRDVQRRVRQRLRHVS
jgi:hypothetical protein